MATDEMTTDAIATDVMGTYVMATDVMAIDAMETYVMWIDVMETLFSWCKLYTHYEFLSNLRCIICIRFLKNCLFNVKSGLEYIVGVES